MNGMSRYFEQPGGSQYFGGSAQSIQQTSWFISPATGSDEADGSSLFTPIRTFSQLLHRRTYGALFDQATSVTVLDDCAEDVSLSPTCSGGSPLVIQGAFGDPIFTGTLTTGTVAWSNAGHQEMNITCAALPTSWTASGLVGSIIRITSGANAGNVTFISKDIGSKTARCAGWMTPDLAEGTAVSGDTFEVLEPVKCTGTWSVDGRGKGFVWFRDIEIGARGSAHSFESYSNVTASSARINGCDTYPSGELYAVGCYIGDGLRPSGKVTLELAACVRDISTAPIDVRQGGALYFYGQNLVDGYGIAIGQGASMVVDASGSVSVSGTVGVTVGSGGVVEQLGYLWCRNTTTRVLEVLPGSVYAYASGRAPANYGSGSPTLGTVGGTTITSLPQTNTSALAAAVVRA